MYSRLVSLLVCIMTRYELFEGEFFSKKKFFKFLNEHFLE
jgi:hypothetical protein